MQPPFCWVIYIVLFKEPAVDPGRALDPNWRPKGRERPPPLYLRVCPPPPPYLKVWIRHWEPIHDSWTSAHRTCLCAALNLLRSVGLIRTHNTMSLLLHGNSCSSKAGVRPFKVEAELKSWELLLIQLRQFLGYLLPSEYDPCQMFFKGLQKVT